MSKQAELERRVTGSACLIGSRERSLLRLGLVAVVGLVVLAVHYLFLSIFLLHPAVTLALVAGTWISIVVRLHRSMRGWLNFILKDSAYGVITETGVTYRSFLRPGCVPWSSVERIEYSPRNGGRIDIFEVAKFTFSRVLPIRFGPSRTNRKALEKIGKILSNRGTPTNWPLWRRRPRNSSISR
jgi:hypothetical protein